MICTTLNDLYYVEWFVQHWMICNSLNYMYYVEWYVLHSYFSEWFVQHWMICTALNDSDYAGWFVQRWIIWTTMSIHFLLSAGCAYSWKHYIIFYSNCWVKLFLIWKYQEEIYSALPQKLIIKISFWSF